MLDAVAHVGAGVETLGLLDGVEGGVDGLVPDGMDADPYAGFLGRDGEFLDLVGARHEEAEAPGAPVGLIDPSGAPATCAVPHDLQ